ncbi:MAG TPA: ComEC family competence protein, partial [Anaerolineaceae bacterium]|nr:ComEC family competence protein [Anaerolineaceae bacterium]
MPLFWLSLAFVLGILLAAAVDLPPAGWLIPAAAFALFAIFEGRFFPQPRYAGARRFFRLPLALLPAVVLLGAGRMALAQPAFTPADLAFYNGRGEAVLTGTVAAVPDRRDRSTQVRVAVDSIAFEGAAPIPVRGQALLRLPGGSGLAYGDRVQVTGSPRHPPEEEGFSYRAYLARRGIHTYLAYPRVSVTGAGPTHPLWQAVYALRGRAYAFLQTAYPMPESALLAGVLLGLERDFPPDLELAYQETGTAHVIAISGFNMAILAALFLSLFGRVLPKGPASLAAVGAIAFYTLLVGANPAVVRAAIMGAAGVLGAFLGRRQT